MYETVDRGAIKNIARYRQSKLISYEGMVRKRNITPTDIDGLIDYNGNAFVYIEGKLYGKNLDYGQKLAFENIIKSHKRAGDIAVVFVFRHTEDSDKIIIAKDKVVSDIYSTETLKWEIPEKETTLLKSIEKFEKYCTEKNIEI